MGANGKAPALGRGFLFEDYPVDARYSSRVLSGAIIENFWAAVEDIWNSSRVVAWLLAMGGISLAVWASFWPQSPGVSIGLLALAAGIMSVRPKMHPAEKFAWVAVLAVFAILEVIAIGHSDKTNEGIRDQQNAKFDGIAEKLKTNIETSKTQYKDTIDHVDGVLEQTKGVAQIAQENLEDVTGGESFGYVIPSLTERGALIAMMVHNDGKQPLTLQVRVLSLTDTCAEWGKIISAQKNSMTPMELKHSTWEW